VRQSRTKGTPAPCVHPARGRLATGARGPPRVATCDQPMCGKCGRSPLPCAHTKLNVFTVSKPRQKTQGHFT
jgi:hypothetical protein